MDRKKRKRRAILSLGIIGVLFIAITVLTIIDFPYDYQPKEEVCIHLYGETHGVREYYEKELEAWETYYADGHRALFVELPYYSAEYLNWWMVADDDTYLELLYEDMDGTLSHTPYVLEFWRGIKANCPETVFVGTDVGHQYFSTGARFLQDLEAKGLQDSQMYQLALENIDQGEIYRSIEAADTYRETKMVENFIAAYERVGEKDIMGIYGSYHTDASYADRMAGMLKEHYGDVVEGKYVINMLANTKKPFSFGFSYFGLIIVAMMIIPNIFSIQSLPEGFAEYSKRENLALQVMEKIGEALVIVLAVLFTDFNPEIIVTSGGIIFPARMYYLILAMVLMILYEIFWIRYFRSKHTMQDFYRGVLGIPLAGAVLPVIAYLLLGFYGRNPAMVVGAILLGVGHIGIHASHAKEAER